ncbi:MAG: CmcJ/NvfI family oxidoreductase, partial [Alphaproteobacteria bacterium]
DCTEHTSAGLVERPIFGAKKEVLKPGQRLVGYNIWRVVSEPPHDQPLAVCNGQTVARSDLVYADGVYDYGAKPWMTSEAFLVKHNPRHRWIYFSDMRPDEALIFRTFASSDGAIGIPHVAFEDPTCPASATGRISVEAHVYAIFDE